MARAITTQRKTINTLFAWAVGLIIFFPILWIFVLSFKSEGDAIKAPFEVLTSAWTLESYATVQDRSDYFKHFWNSVTIAVGSTLLGILVAVPAAWSMAFVPSKRTRGILMWMLSTKMLPAVGVLYPIYIGFIKLGLLDTRIGLVIVLMLINLPIIVWMLYTYFKEIPGEILEAARMDGAGLREEVLYVLTPMAVPGIASTLLLNVILAWNEAFWTLNLTAAKAAPLTAFIASYSSPEGLFYAKLSAASVMAMRHQRDCTVGVMIGGTRWHGQAMRETGFRTYLREYAPQVQVLDTLVNLETRQLTYEATLDLLNRVPDLAGMYVAGGGMEGAIAAVREARPPNKIALIVNELTPESRSALADRYLTLVVATPLETLCHRLIESMVQRIQEPEQKPSIPAMLEPLLYLPESI
mgnify:CR=1 FL=1